MANHDQFFLLADHIKLSLLERQRATHLNLYDETQDGHISRSLDQLRTGIASLRKQKSRYEQEGEEELASNLADSLFDLERRLNDLTTEFDGSPDDTSRERTSDEIAGNARYTSYTRPKTVRFNDSPFSDSEQRPGLYQDDPESNSAGYRGEAKDMTNQQLQQYHSQILQDQDEQLDRLGESIGRQREISMQIGEELENHVTLLDEMDTVVDRHQNRVDRARTALGRVANGAGENKQMTAIIVLIIILVLLIAILK